MNKTLIYALLMLAAGLGIPLMAVLNGGLGFRFGSPALTATVLFSMGLVLAIIYLFSTGGLPDKLNFALVP